MVDYHYVRALEAFADIDPDRVLVATPERTISARELRDNAAGLAGFLREHSVRAGRPVGMMLFNRPAILETFYAALMAGSPPVNVNPRYLAAEIAQVLDDCDAVALVHEAAAAAAAGGAARLLGRPLLLIEAGSAQYVAALASLAAPRREPRGDDQILQYTGGTTGRPRGVVWDVDTHYRMLWEVIKPSSDPPHPADLAARRTSAPTALPASPLAHGTALGLALSTLIGGGTVVLHEQASFAASSTLDLVDRYAVRVLGIVGDAYARPLLAELDTGRWKGRLQSLAVISSSGAVWSPQVRARLADHLPGIRLIDNFGSTEAAVSRDTAGNGFQPREGVVVLGPGDQPVRPGSGQVGVVAAAGRLPLGYLNDPAKTAAAFRVVNGVRHFVSGDRATVSADGSIRVLGRGDSCINTGGEKVWPEEVELVVRDHPAVTDAAIIGLPDEKWGQRVTAVVSLRPGAAVTDEELGAHCRAGLTPYKCPKQWLRVPHVPRTYVGKPDYAAIRALSEGDTWQRSASKR